MEQAAGVEELLRDVSKEDAFVAGVLSGAILASRERAGEEDEAGQARLRLVARQVMESSSEELLANATEALRHLREDLGCSICWGLMSCPVALQCGHSFCHPCIATWTRAKSTCPVCRCPTLSYKSYAPNLALKGLVKRLGAPETADGWDERLERDGTAAPGGGAWDASWGTAVPAPGPLGSQQLAEIRLRGRFREQSGRHPYQRDIRRRLRERERAQILREELQRQQAHVTEELRRRTFEPRFRQLLEQLSRVQMLQQAAGDAPRATPTHHTRSSSREALAGGIAGLMDSLRSSRNGRQTTLLDEIRSVTRRRAAAAVNEGRGGPGRELLRQLHREMQRESRAAAAVVPTRPHLEALLTQLQARHARRGQ